jgi:resuscitation-promoting factor RpfC
VLLAASALAIGWAATTSHPAPALAATSRPAAHSAPAALTAPSAYADQQAARAAAVAAMPAPVITVTVGRGQTLTSIAGTACRPSWWPELWWANRRHLHNPNLLLVHASLTLPPCGPVSPRHAALAEAAIPKPPPPPPAPVAVSVPPATGPAPAAPAVSAPAAGGGVTPSSGYEACVIAAESGGNAGIVNASSGAGGLYQFLPSTWASLGYSGLPQDASPATQQQAFDRLYAQAGSAPWSSDGC